MSGTEVATSPGQEIAALEAEMPDRRSDYWKNESKQARYRDLVEARRNHTATPKADAKSNDRREIELLMRNSRSEYWKGAKNSLGETTLQERYRQLLTGEHGAEKAETWRLTVEAASQKLPAAAIEAWQQSGDLPAKLQLAENTWQRLYHGVGDAKVAQALEIDFAGLPEGVRSAAYVELASGEPTFSRAATDDELSAFANIDGGACAKAWGKLASQRLGVALARLDRLRATLGAGDQSSYDRFLQYLSPREKIAVVWTLARS